jgi:hypothetical protein
MKKQSKSRLKISNPRTTLKSLKESSLWPNRIPLSPQLNTIGIELIQAKKLGITNTVDKLAFLYKTILKEQVLLTKGYDRFVRYDDVAKFIDLVKPSNSVKIVEMSRYPRIIPTESAEKIIALKELNLFDEILIVYTDYTKQKIETPEEKKMVARNRDPIAFGVFYNATMNLKHDRLYFITDWEDEFCDLTFSSMIEKMAELGIEDAEQKIGVDHAYVNQLADNTLESIKNRTSSRFNNDDAILISDVVEKPKLVDRVFKFIKGLLKK